MKPLKVAPAPPQPEARKRAPRPKPDADLLQFVLGLFRALNGATFRERAQLRADAHRAVDAFFDKKLATR